MITASRATLVPAAAVLALLVGLGLLLVPGGRPGAHVVWTAAVVVLGLPLVARTLHQGVARGQWATDLVAALAIVTALLLDEPFAGLVVVLMQTGGEALEAYAAGRASAAVRALEAAAPRLAHRLTTDGPVEIAAEQVAVGDLLLVRPGELVPCDGEVTEGTSHVDTSALTGEPIPLRAGPGTLLRSGSANGEGALTLRALATAGESQYARIVDLVRQAQASKAPIQRLADRYAIWFTPLTLAVCALAWAASGDAGRVLAVLVVATPCPLILAVPVALIGGINRAAARQVIVRTGGALERLGRVTAAVFDKTGTLTVGRPDVRQVHARAPFREDELLRLAAAVEVGSSHQLARPLVAAARARFGALPAANAITEAPGQGVTGVVDGREVVVGSLRFVASRVPSVHGELQPFHDGEVTVRASVAIDGSGAGVIEYADRVRPEARAFLARLPALGVRRQVLLSGDHVANAERIAREVGIGEARGDLLPQDKVTLVRALQAEGESVLMVGDGTNDAPALSAADVGVALAEHGGGITAEAADVVVLVDDLGRVADALAIGRRTMAIARQSIWLGLTASGAAMVFAALGYIPPAIGALLQEAIDVATILNALRAAGGDEV